MDSASKFILDITGRRPIGFMGRRLFSCTLTASSDMPDNDDEYHIWLYEEVGGKYILSLTITYKTKKAPRTYVGVVRRHKLARLIEELPISPNAITELFRKLLEKHNISGLVQMLDYAQDKRM